MFAVIALICQLFVFFAVSIVALNNEADKKTTVIAGWLAVAVPTVWIALAVLN
ncbi:hypothetical protein M3626_20910 [Psychrobacillus sp. MER TA 17]|nr:hypothetical protein [Psychrobacillus sp. MER TA 17]